MRILHSDRVELPNNQTLKIWSEQNWSRVSECKQPLPVYRNHTDEWQNFAEHFAEKLSWLKCIMTFVLRMLRGEYHVILNQDMNICSVLCERDDEKYWFQFFGYSFDCDNEKLFILFTWNFFNHSDDQKQIEMLISIILFSATCFILPAWSPSPIRHLTYFLFRSSNPKQNHDAWMHWWYMHFWQGDVVTNL